MRSPRFEVSVHKAALRAPGEEARYATACAVDPTSSGWKLGRKYVNVAENKDQSPGKSPRRAALKYSNQNRGYE